MMELPIVCTLSEEDLQKRRRDVLEGVYAAVIKTTELPDGYLYEFAFGAEILTTLARLVSLEHDCCRFLTFRISAQAGEALLKLEITGPAEAKPVIAAFFGVN
jgi:hypothetical protein